MSEHRARFASLQIILRRNFRVLGSRMLGHFGAKPLWALRSGIHRLGPEKRSKAWLAVDRQLCQSFIAGVFRPGSAK